jgi:hypothetical protein
MMTLGQNNNLQTFNHTGLGIALIRKKYTFVSISVSYAIIEPRLPAWHQYCIIFKAW